MKRGASGKAFVASVALSALCFFGHLWAQASRDNYRAAYKTWRDSEPKLELDAATAGAALAPRTIRVAAQEATYSAARSAFLRQVASEFSAAEIPLRAVLPSVPPSPAPVAELQHFVEDQTTALSANISAFAKDTDPTIRPLQQALDREQAALSALNSAILDRQKAEDKAAQAVAAMDQSRNAAIEKYQAVLAAISGSADSMDRETAAWGGYYQKLAEGARAIAAAARPPEPAPRPSITTLPLPRYTGAWTYSSVGGLFHGAEPEFVDLVVHEENGKASGTFYARFKLPPGSTGDPIVKFDFSGDFRAAKIQTFALETSDGAKGTMDLIPGNAFNLLEVNFETEIKPGKVHLGDVLLVKK
jgi:hypothetical protein